MSVSSPETRARTAADISSIQERAALSFCFHAMTIAFQSDKHFPYEKANRETCSVSCEIF